MQEKPSFSFMKINTLLCCSLLLLFAVACHSEEEEVAQSSVPVITAPQVILNPAAPNVSLDSFTQYYSASYPVAASLPPAEKSKMFIRRDKDSLTVSGVVYAADARSARTAWRFYFKASGRQCYAYLKQDYSRVENGLQKRSSRETGYCLHFFRTES